MSGQPNEVVSHYSNCWAALYAAAGWAADSRGNQMRANGGIAEEQLHIELKEFGTSWTIHLGSGAQYVSHPRSFQASWMSQAHLRSMIEKERHAISQDKVAPLQNSYNWYSANYNSCINDAQSDPSHAGSYYSNAASYLSHMKALRPQIDAYKAEEQAGGNLSTVSDLNTAWAALRGGSFQAHPLVNTSQFTQSYLNHTRVNVSIPTYENHIASLVRAGASDDQIMAAQAVLNEAKTQHNTATTDAQQGVQQAQNAVSQDASNGKNDVNLVKALNETLQACSVGTGFQ